MSDITTMQKVAALPKIMEAARTLYLYGLSKEEPAAVVKRYVEANPDINDVMRRSAGQ